MRSDNCEPRHVLTIGYFGAAFDLMSGENRAWFSAVVSSLKAVLM